ncbi:MAG: tyrosine-type recombinase/integrase [Candidatus Geothermarchaeales archaeon]
MTALASAIETISLSTGEMLRRFTEDCGLRRMMPETIRSYLSYLGTMGRFLEARGRSFLDLRPEDLKAILAYALYDRRLRPKTVRAYFSALSCFCDFLQYEGIIQINPVPSFRKRYLRDYKKRGVGNNSFERQLLTIEQMRDLVGGTLDPRDRAILMVLAKTGIRRNELVCLDVEDVDFATMTIRLKPHPKRTNLVLFVDDECARALRAWLVARENYKLRPSCTALFVGQHGDRLQRQGVYEVVTSRARVAGLHDLRSRDPRHRFTPHAFRHWFTTWLRRNGMRREFIQELRGDVRGDAVDLYDHIDREELRRAYLACIPRLGM